MKITDKDKKLLNELEKLHAEYIRKLTSLHEKRKKILIKYFEKNN
jgi:hypothetical protein